MILSFVLSGTLLLATIDIWRFMLEARRELSRIRDWQPEQQPSDWPRVSILITARDEELHLELAAKTLLSLDYPSLQLIAVNDRSQDKTGSILDSLAEQDSRLMVVHIDDLPSGWLGKNHALQQAAARADGEYLLMTDADVFMDSLALQRAVAYAGQHQLDHLALLPEAEAKGFWLQAFINTFALMFTIYFKPWRARRKSSRHFVGIGAFNLVRRDVFEHLEGMTAIRMRPDDDLMLGKLIKKHEYRQDVMDGVGMVRVPWYATLGEAIRGLEKNAFAGAGYSLLRVGLMTFSAFAVFIGPWVGVCLADSPARWIFLASGLLQALLAVGSASALRYSPASGLVLPLSVLLMIYTQWRATALTLARGGISWRGTRYSLDELKANRV